MFRIYPHEQSLQYSNLENYQLVNFNYPVTLLIFSSSYSCSRASRHCLSTHHSDFTLIHSISIINGSLPQDSIRLCFWRKQQPNFQKIIDFYPLKIQHTQFHLFLRRFLFSSFYLFLNLKFDFFAWEMIFDYYRGKFTIFYRGFLVNFFHNLRIILLHGDCLSLKKEEDILYHLNYHQ